MIFLSFKIFSLICLIDVLPAIKSRDTLKYEEIIKDAFDVNVDSFNQAVSYHMRMYDIKKDYESWKKAWNYDQIG